MGANTGSSDPWGVDMTYFSLARLRRSATAVALLIALAATLSPLTSGASPSAHAMPPNSAWRLITTEGSSMMGLAGDANGNLLTYNDGNLLQEIPSNLLTQAMAGTPVPSSSVVTLDDNSGAEAGEWIAGIVPLSDGSILFNSGAQDTIWNLGPSDVVTTVLNGVPLDAPSGMALAAGGSSIYVSNQANERVYRMGVDGSNPVEVANGLTDPQALAVDAQGDLFIADLGGGVYEETAAELGSGSPASPGSGLVTIANGAGTSGVNGLTLDAYGDLFFSTYDNSDGPTVGEVALSTIDGGALPATTLNGGIIDIADTTNTPFVDSGEQPITVVGNTLYVGSWSSHKIYGLSLSAGAVTHLVVSWHGRARLAER